jgi:GNAT superfamily N-acetyltransferase
MILRKIAEVSDPAFAKAISLYESSFVSDERVDSDFVRSRLEEGSRFEIVEVVLESSFIGFAMLDAIEVRPGWLLGEILYFAIDPNVRGRGYGEVVYGLILDRFADASTNQGLKFAGLLYEVERPELALEEHDRKLRQRRLDFYCRLGGRPLEGIDYVQPSLGEGKVEVHMHLVYHAMKPYLAISDKELHREFMLQMWGVEV